MNTTSRTRPPLAWWLVTLLAVPIVGYALAYVIVGAPLYPPNLSASFLARPWGIYPHALFGSLALGIGALQFNRWLLIRHRALHRALGTMYVVCCAFVGLAGLYMSIYAFGGPVSHLGFGTLAVLLLWATMRAYLAARARTIAVHRRWMLVSYALIFAAVTLRIELPLLIMAFGDFTPAYRVVAWVSWVPNLLWALWYGRRTAGIPLPAVERLRAA
ncbi:MAG TPA: DUF2306 domain-containing protein [Gemmatimonadaceae bacterium]|nr:DUF2306 domain-containing protein [Gemmatimonadaceae bacterium]